VITARIFRPIPVPDSRISYVIGDRLYLVTFKRVDPFFVIDLATPTAPKILGKLKIPGYSDYLHPYDATHIIGVGKETGTNDWGGVSTKGLKLALFDVSDVEHPAQLDKARWEKLVRDYGVKGKQEIQLTTFCVKLQTLLTFLFYFC